MILGKKYINAITIKKTLGLLCLLVGLHNLDKNVVIIKKKILISLDGCRMFSF